MAAYTGNNHAYLRHKHFTDNNRDQQTSRADLEMDPNLFSQCKNNQCGSKNTHAAVPEKLTINFVWPWGYYFSIIKISQ